jgi:trk system potassium uptake protein TrkA
MYIIVVGCGKVGLYLSRTLLEEGHELLVIEQDETKCARASEELGSIVIRGDGCEAATLTEAGTNRADMVMAVTGDDEDNLVVCQVAKKKFGVPQVVARINNPSNEAIFKKLGIDVTISSTELILEHLEREVPTHPLTRLQTLNFRGLEIVSIRIPAHSTVVGRPLRELTLPPESLLAAVINEEKGAQVPTGDTVLNADDEVVAVTKAEYEVELREVLIGS